MSSLRTTSLGAVLALFLRTPHLFPTEPILLNNGVLALPFSFMFSLSAASAMATSESGLACRARTLASISEDRCESKLARALELDPENRLGFAEEAVSIANM